MVAPDDFQDQRIVRDTCPVLDTVTDLTIYGGRLSKWAMGERVIASDLEQTEIASGHFGFSLLSTDLCVPGFA